MNELCRWVDELPADSPDRALLFAGRAAQPPSESKERTWHALTAAFGVAAASVAAPAQAGAASATAGSAAGATQVAAGATQVAAAKGALATIVASLAAKGVAVGFAVGIGAIGVAQVATHAIHRATPHNQSTAPSAATTHSVSIAPTAGRAVPGELALPATDAPEPAAATSERIPVAARAVASDPGNAHATLAPRADAPERATPPTALPEITTQQGESTPAARSETETTAGPTTRSLAEQARGLSRIQRLLDAGNTSDAIRQLEVSFSSSDYASLTEERDALYVQALFRSQRTSQANLWAKRFVQRYPNSPHVEKIRRLVDGK